MPKSYGSHVQEWEGCLLITLPDSIDMDSSRLIESNIIPELDKQNKDVVLDFSKTSAVYSSGLGLVIRVKNRVQTTGHAVYLVNLSDRLKEALVNVGLHQVLETFDGLDELKTALEERSGEE